MKNALSHRPETFAAREMTAPSSARPFLYSSSQLSACEDSWVVNGVSTTGTRWSCSWFWSPTLPTTSPRRCSPSSTSAATTSTWLRQEDQVYPPGVADGGQARDGGLGVLPGHRGEPLFQAAAPAQCGVMRAAAHTPAYTTPNLHYHELQFCSEESTQPAPVFCGSPSSTPRPCGSETRPRRPRPAPRGPRGSRRGPGTPSPALKTGTKSIKVCSVIVSLTLVNAHYFSIHASHVQ